MRRQIEVTLVEGSQAIEVRVGRQVLVSKVSLNCQSQAALGTRCCGATSTGRTDDALQVKCSLLDLESRQRLVGKILVWLGDGADAARSWRHFAG